MELRHVLCPHRPSGSRQRSLIALAVYLLFVAVRWPIERWWKGRDDLQSAEPDEDPRTLRERMEEDDDLPLRGYGRDRNGRMEPRI